eukprot:m.53077 g.53077  ORF g.53077 m.53077 type:complete len:152 (-) comp21705_c0_seq4:77-532(-)
MAISCAAVIGQKNQPLYIRTATDDPALRFQHAVYSSMDVIDEKVATSTKSSADRDMFLGRLFPADEHRLYGYITSTNVKFVLVVSDPKLADRDIRKFFRTLHDHYIQLVGNPFYKPGGAITSKKFDDSVATLMGAPKNDKKQPRKDSDLTS